MSTSKTSGDITERLPKIYCYTTPGVSYHDGWVKIGYTTQNNVEDRILQQTKTAGIKAQIEWTYISVFDDNTAITFTDDDFKAFLDTKGVCHENDFGKGSSLGDEWYNLSPEQAKGYFDEYKKTVPPEKYLAHLTLRDEQQRAINTTTVAQVMGQKEQMLWNAKPRFGKCLAAYNYCLAMDLKKVLIVSNRPSVFTSWYSDYSRYIGRVIKTKAPSGEIEEKPGYFFVSRDSNVKNEDLTISYDAFAEDKKSREEKGIPLMGLIYCASLQDIKDSSSFGGDYEKLSEIATVDWDVMIVDESHEGIDTKKTRHAFSSIKHHFTLYLTGTPFKALANDQFKEDEIYNWSYVDEQQAKERWNGEGENPYEVMPRLNINTYNMANIIGEQSADISEDGDDMSVSMNDFFATKGGVFVHDKEVDLFLDAISSNAKYPFAPSQRDDFKHTFWLMFRKEGVEAMAKKLESHPAFQDYRIVKAIGQKTEGITGEEEDKLEGKAFNTVRKAIDTNERTITLSVGQLTTGVTIPEWTGVMMLSDCKSPAEYMQACFRVQNPHVFKIKDTLRGTIQYRQKTDGFVFAFSPAHTLDIVEQFANNLISSTAGGKGDYNERYSNIETLLKYLPVSGEDENGNIISYDPDQVIKIPGRIKSQEVVRRGFMSNLLFQNVEGVIFRNAAEGMKILNKVSATSAFAKPVFTKEDEEKAEEVRKHTDPKTGGIKIPGKEIEEKAKDLIPEEKEEKIKEDTKTELSGIVDMASIPAVSSSAPVEKKKEARKKKEEAESKTIEIFTKKMTDTVVQQMKENGETVSKKTEEKIRKEVKKKVEEKVSSIYERHGEEKRHAADNAELLKAEVETEEDRKAADELMQEDSKRLDTKLKEDLTAAGPDLLEEAKGIGVKVIEEEKTQKDKDDLVAKAHQKLRDFSRTIPSFLMAYGDDDFSLENMETYVPESVFEEVTGITLNDFVQLRDEYRYFDPYIFNQSVSVFLNKMRGLSAYFEEDAKEDIFDYIPPQKTNQIYTPKTAVEMVEDYLAEETDGIFDDPDKTFVDLYMKSGLFVTEVVKRLYRSEKMQELFPDPDERLKHIFEKQVYGLAPTEIIYSIAKRYILGWDEKRKIIGENHHLRQIDALPYAQNGTLEEMLEGEFA